MSRNSHAIVLLLASLSGCSIDPAAAATEVCPRRHDAPLRFVEVFDGDPKERATLIPDSAKEESGGWQLGYMYDAGRLLTIRCKYADGKTLDVKLSRRVSACRYKIDAKKTLKLYCT